MGIEKVDFSENGLEMGDQKYIGRQRKSFIRHPIAMFFERDFWERVFQQPQGLALIDLFRSICVFCKLSYSGEALQMVFDFTLDLDVVATLNDQSRSLPRVW